MASYSRSSFGTWSVDAVGVLFQLYCGFLNSTGKERRRKSHLNFLITALGLHFTASVGTNCLNNFSPPFFSPPKTDVPGLTHQQSGQRAAHHQFPNSLSLSPFRKWGPAANIAARRRRKRCNSSLFLFQRTPEFLSHAKEGGGGGDFARLTPFTSSSVLTLS